MPFQLDGCSDNVISSCLVQDSTWEHTLCLPSLTVADPCLLILHSFNEYRLCTQQDAPCLCLSAVSSAQVNSVISSRHSHCIVLGYAMAAYSFMVSNDLQHLVL